MTTHISQADSVATATDSSTHPQRALIVGLGIAGIATAIRLHQIGWQPVIIERAPARRKGGYTVVLFETGQASAKRLNIFNALIDRTHPDAITYEINRANRRHKGAGLADQPGSPRQMLRGDIENALFNALPPEIELRFSTVPSSIEQTAAGVTVILSNSATGTSSTERFDLVVGADGLRSSVRKLVFGPHENYLAPMQYMIGACVLSKPVAGYALHDGIVLAEPGRSVWVFGFADHNPTVLFSYRVDDIQAQFAGRPIDALRTAFKPKPNDTLLNSLLNEFEHADESLFDSVNQVQMEHWHKGRVVLVGDSAWCLSLYSGMGASAGLVGGELLGTLLAENPTDIGKALSIWEAKLRPFIAKQQANAHKMRVLFTPQNKRQWMLRKVMLRVMTNPVASKLMLKFIGDVSDKMSDDFAA